MLTPKTRSLLHTVWRTLNAWDFWLAFLVSAAVAVALVITSHPIKDSASYAPAMIAGGAALATFAFVALRWLTDRLKDSAYGELIRSHDHDETELAMPYWLVGFSGLATVLVGVAGLVVSGGLPKPALITYWALGAFIGVYTALGSLSIASLTIWHQRKHGQIQSDREALYREVRKRRRNDERRSGPSV